MTTITDQDEAQEYECLLLEGHSPDEARRLARAANNKINRDRLSGPRSADRNGHGRVPYISDYRWDHDLVDATIVGHDTRSPDELEADHGRQDEARALLVHLTPRQAAILDALYGLTTGTPLPYKEVARRFGCEVKNIDRARERALRTIRRETGNLTEADVTKVAKRRKKRNGGG